MKPQRGKLQFTKHNRLLGSQVKLSLANLLNQVLLEIYSLLRPVSFCPAQDKKSGGATQCRMNHLYDYE